MKNQTKPEALLDLLDQANACTLKILTLADLLAGHDGDPFSEAATVGNTGDQILHEARRLRDLLEKLRP